MLPVSLCGRHGQYKKDTNFFLAWLARTAQDCGYKCPVIVRPMSHIAPSKIPEHVAGNTKGRLKGKARIEAKKLKAGHTPNTNSRTDVPQHYVVSTAEILKQAQMIAKHKPPVEMPPAVWYCAREALRSRIRYTTWFQRNISGDEEATERHDFFNSVLRNAINILSAETSRVVENAARLTVEDTRRLVDLEVQPKDDTPEDTEPVVALETEVIADQTYEVRPAVQYEAEADVEDASQMQKFCLFEDLEEIRNFIQETWKQYDQSALDIITASVVTNAALDLVRLREQDLSVFYNMESLADLENPLNCFCATSDATSQKMTIDQLFRAYYRDTASCLALFNRSCEAKQSYPTRMLRWEKRPWEDSTPVDRKDEDLFLSQYMIDLQVECLVKEVHPEDVDELPASPYILDELSTSLLRLRKPAKPFGRIQPSTVFGGQILLDLRKLLGDKSEKAYAALERLGRDIGKITEPLWGGYDIMEYQGKERVCNELPTCEKMRTLRLMHIEVTLPRSSLYRYSALAALPKNHDLYGMHQDVKNGLGQRMLNLMRRMPEELQNHLGDKERRRAYCQDNIPPPSDSLFLRKSNAALTGTLQLELLIAFEDFGLRFANSFSSVSAMAHVYNALRQNGLLTSHWPAMEEIIEIHGHVLFNGAAPTSAYECLTRLRLFTGTSLRKLASENQQNGFRSTLKTWTRDVKELHPAPLSQLLQDLFSGRDTMSRTIFRLDELIQKSKAMEKKQGPKYLNRDRDTIEVLKGIREYIPSILPRLCVDYITLTRTCNALFREIDGKLPGWCKLWRTGTDWYEPGLGALSVALGLLAELKVFECLMEQYSIRLPPGPHHEQRMIVVTAKILEGYIAAGAKGVPGEAEE